MTHTQQSPGLTPPPPTSNGTGTGNRGNGAGSREAIRAIEEAITNGTGGIELVALIEELSDTYDLPQRTLEQAAHAAQERLSSSAELEAAAQALLQEQDRRELAAALTLADLLPARAAAAVEVLTRHLPSDPIASALLVLCGFSGVLRLGSEIVVAPATGYIEPLLLFGGIVATSGQKKSPLFRCLVRDRLRSIVQEIRASYRSGLEQWEALKAKREEEGKPAPPRPREGRAITTSYTAEALMSQLAINEQQGLGLLVAIDELDGLFASANAYRAGRGADEQILLELYDGNGQEILRVKDDVDRRFDRCRVSICGTIQPEVLAARVREGDPTGKWARFCWAAIPRRVCPLPDGDGLDEGFRAAAEALDRIYQQGHRITAQQYRLDPAGRGIFRDYEERCQREALEATHGAVRALRSKAAGKVARIAGILHVLAIACDEAFGPVVDAQLVGRAVTLVDLLDGWTAGLHQRGAGSEGASADELMRKIHQLSLAGGAVISASEVLRKLSRKQRRNVDGQLIGLAMAKLAQLGCGEVTVSERGVRSYLATGGLPQ